MASHFGREFRFLDESHLADLQTLEMEGCLYAYLFQDDLQDFAYVRIRLRPAEIVRYVDGLRAYEQFLNGVANGLSAEQALASISSMTIRHTVDQHNDYARTIGAVGTDYCAAAFLGQELEELICTNVPARHEVLGRTYSADRRFLLDEVISGLPDVVAFLGSRQGERHPYVVENEQDLRDLLYALLKPVFPDVALEDPVPKLAGNSKRIDIVVATIKTVVELKIVRDRRHGARVADELRTDIESYHSHPSCSRLLCVVWDGGRVLADRTALMRDLSGARRKGASAFVVDVRVVP